MIDPTWKPAIATTDCGIDEGQLDDAALSVPESAVLEALRRAPNRVLSRHELSRIAGLGSTQSRRVDVLLVRIRRTLDGEAIINVRNRGWRLMQLREVDVGSMASDKDTRVSA